MIVYKCYLQFQSSRAFKYELQYDDCLQILAIIMLYFNQKDEWDG